jgi:hypothetical protein
MRQGAFAASAYLRIGKGRRVSAVSAWAVTQTGVCVLVRE